MMTIRRSATTLLYLTFFCIADILISTICFVHLNKFKDHFIADVRFFNFSTSFFELWVFSAVRLIISVGTLIGVMKNPLLGLERVKCVELLIFALAATMWSYGVVKMLVYSETTLNWKDDGWFWGLFSCNIAASLLFFFHWMYVISRLSPLSDSSQDNCVNHQSSSTIITEINAVNTHSEDVENTRIPEDVRQPLINEADNKERPNEGDTTVPKKSRASTVSRLLRMSKPDWYLVVTAFFFLLCACTAETFTPLFIGRVIQGIAIERDQHKFTVAIIYLTLFSLAGAVASSLRGWFFSVTNFRLNIRLRNLLFASVVKQEVGFFDTVKTGDISSRLQSDTTIMANTLGLNLNVFLRSTIKAIGVVVFMMRLSWRLSMVTWIGLPVITAFSTVYGNYYEKLSERVQEALAKSNEVAEETCSSMRTVRSFASESQENLRYQGRMANVYKLNLKEARVYAGYLFSNNIFTLVLTVATLYYGGHLVLSSFMSAGDLVSFILYQEELGNCIENIGYVYTGLMQAVGASTKVFEYIDRPPKIENTGKLAPPELKGKIEFENVTFAYPSRPDTVVLKNVSFAVEPGEVVALVGPSGGGKSSCVNLLEHFYEALEGQVLVDGQPLHLYDHNYLHEKISLVGQEPVLFARSIRENIAYGIEGCLMERIEIAAKMANAHDFIMDLKDKYDTEAGEKGAQLSGGQKQRVAIARAIIRNPAILLLDEATSALDSESEYVVQQALYQNLKDRTVLIIAHRLSTVEKASRIIVIDKGKVVEQGTHLELLRNNNMYAKLVQRQLLGFESSASLGKETSRENKIATANSYFDSGEDGVKYSTPRLTTSVALHMELKAKDSLSFGSFESFGTTP